MAKPTICRTCGNWFLLHDDRGCPICVGGEQAPTPERGPFKLTHDDWNFLKTNRIAPWEDDSDDGA